MTSLIILLGFILTIIFTSISLKGIYYYKQLPQAKKDWINQSRIQGPWYTGFKSWRYANIPDGGDDKDFTKLNQKIKVLARKNQIIEITMFIFFCVYMVSEIIDVYF